MNKDKALVWDRLKNGLRKSDAELHQLALEQHEAMVAEYKRIEQEMKEELYEKSKQVYTGTIIPGQKDPFAKGTKGSRGNGRACESGTAVRQRERDFAQIYRQKTYTGRGR